MTPEFFFGTIANLVLYGLLSLLHYFSSRKKWTALAFEKKRSLTSVIGMTLPVKTAILYSFSSELLKPKLQLSLSVC
jgi:hypothetical protein